MNKLFYIIFLLLFITFIIYIRDERINMPKHSIKKYENILSQETLELFKDYNFIKGGIYGDMIVDIFEYDIHEVEISRIYKNKIYKFVENDNQSGKKQQIAVYLNDYFQFNKALNLIKKDLSKFYKIDNNIKFKLRISKTPWNYGAHFDCFDGKLLQLFNQRKVATLNYDVINNDYFKIKNSSINDLKKIYKNVNEIILNPGDLIEIPLGITHTTEGHNIYSNKNISILLSFHFNKEKNNICENHFQKYFKKRINELENNII